MFDICLAQPGQLFTIHLVSSSIAGDQIWRATNVLIEVAKIEDILCVCVCV